MEVSFKNIKYAVWKSDKMPAKYSYATGRVKTVMNILF